MILKSRITNGPHGVEISIPPTKGAWFIAIMFLACSLLLVGFMAIVFPHEPKGVFASLVCTAVVPGLVLAGLVWIQDFKGPTLVCLEPEYIIVTRKVLGFTRRWTINSCDVNNLRAQYYYDAGELGGSFEPGIAIEYLGRVRCLVGDLSEEEAEYLVDQIKRRYQDLSIVKAPGIDPVLP